MHNPSTLLNLEPADAIPSIISTLKTLSQNGGGNSISITDHTADSTATSLIKSTQNGVTKLMRLKGAGTVTINENTSGILQISGAIAEVQNANAEAVSLLTSGSADTADDGKLRKLLADENSGLSITQQTGASQKEAQLSVVKRTNVLQVSATAHQFTLTNTKRNQTNVFRFANSTATDNPSSVKLSINEAGNSTWANIGALELFNDTTVNVTVSGSGVLLPQGTDAVLQPGCAMQLQSVGGGKVAVVGSGTSITDYASSATGKSLIKETKDGSTKMMRLKGTGTVSINENTSGILQISGAIAEVQNANAEAVSLLTSGSADTADDGKLRKLLADENSGLSITQQTGASQKEAQLSVVKRTNVLQVSATAHQFTLTNTKRNQTNVFRFANSTATDNPSSVKLSINEAGNSTWANIGALELFNDTTVNVTVSGSGVLLPQGTDAVLQPGCAMQLQSVGGGKVAVVGSGTSITDYASSATGKSLIKETKDGSTKMMRLKGTGTVSINENTSGILQISGAIAEVQNANAEAVSLLTSGSADTADDGKLRKLLADENSGLSITQQTGASQKEAQLSVVKRTNVLQVSATAHQFTLTNTKRNQTNVFRFANSTATDNPSSVKLSINEAGNSTWANIGALELFNDTTVNVTVSGSGVLLPQGTDAVLQPGCAMQLQSVGGGKVAVVGGGTSITDYASSATGKSLIKETKDGSTKMMRLKGTGTVSINENTSGILQISGAIAEVQNANAEAVSLLTSGSADTADDGKLRKLLADENSGLSITQQTGASQKEAQLSVVKRTNVLQVSATAHQFTLTNTKRNQTNVFRFANSTATDNPSSVKLSINEAGNSTWANIGALELFNDTTVNVTVSGSGVLLPQGTDAVLQPGCAMQLQSVGGGKVAVVGGGTSITDYASSATGKSLIKETKDGSTKMMRLKGTGTVSINENTSGILQISGAIAEVQNANAEAVSLLTSGSADTADDGKLRKLLADENSGLSITQQTGASQKEAQLSVVKRTNVLQVSATAHQFTLTNTKRNQTNVFRFANCTATDNPSSVKLSINEAGNSTWANIGALELFNDTTVNVTVSGSGVLLPQGTDAVLQPGCAMQLQSVGGGKVAVVGSGTSITDYASSATGKSLIKETKDGSTKMMRLKGTGTVSINENTSGILQISGSSGAIAEVQNANAEAVSLLTSGSADTADDGKLRKLLADENSGLSITQQTGASQKEAQLSVVKRTNVLQVSATAHQFTLTNTKRNQTNVFRFANSTATDNPSSVKLSINEAGNSTWANIGALELFNDTTVNVTVSGSGVLLPQGTDAVLQPGCAMQLQSVGGGKVAVVGSGTSITDYASSATGKSLIKETKDGSTKMMRLKGTGTVSINENTSGILQISGAIAEVQNANAEAVSLLTSGSADTADDGKLRKLLADENSGLSITQQTGASQKEAQLSVVKRTNVLQVSATAHQFTLTNTKRNQTNVFRFANSTATDNPSSVKLSINEAGNSTWANIGALELFNDTTVNVTVSGSGVLLPQGTDAVLQPGCAMQLQSVGGGKVAVVGSGTSITDYASSATGKSLIKETKDGSTKMMRLKGTGTVSINENTSGILQISGAIAEVQNANAEAVSLLTSGSADTADDGKLRKLLADENSGLSITQQTGASQKEAQLSVVKRTNVLQVSATAHQFTLTNTKRNQTNVFRFANSTATDNPSSVKLSINEAGNSTWANIGALELFNDTTVNVTVSGSGVLLPQGTDAVLQPGCAMQLQSVGGGKVAVVGSGTSITDYASSATGKSLIKETKDGSTKMMRLKGTGTVSINENTSGILQISGAIAEVQNANAEAVSLLTSGSADTADDGKLRKLLADENSGLSITQQTGASQKEAQLSVVKRTNVLQVSATAHQFTLTNTKRNQTNVFRFANSTATDNPSSVKLSINEAGNSTWANIGALELFNDTTVNVTVSGSGVLLPQGTDAVLQPGCAMQLQSVGGGKVAVVGSGTSITDYASSATGKSLIKETKDGSTKMMRLKGTGTVSINENTSGILQINGAIAEVQNANAEAVSLLTSGSADTADDGKLRKLLADENSGLSITQQTGASQKEAQLSVVKRTNVLQVSATAHQFTLTNTKRNQTNVFRFANSTATDNPSSVKLSINEAGNSTWANIGALELFNDTTVNVTVSGSGVLLPQGIDAVLQPGCAMQLQSVGGGKVAVVGSGTSITDYASSATGKSLIKETKDGSTKMMRLKGTGTVSINENTSGILQISGAIAEVQNANAEAVSLLTSGSADTADDGKLRKLLADENSGLSITQQTGASQREAQLSVVKRTNVLQVSATAHQFTLTNTKRNQTNVFRFANSTATDNPSSVKLSINEAGNSTWANIGALELFNDTTVNVTVSGSGVLLPQGTDAVLQPGCAMQLQSVGGGKVAVVGSGTSITDHTADSTAASLIKSTQDGVTKLMRLQGAGTVTINEESPGGVLKITGSQYTSVTETTGSIGDSMAGKFNIHTESADVQVRISSECAIGSTVYLFNASASGNSMRITAQNGQSINSPFGYDAIKSSGLGILTKIEDGRYSLSGDLTYKQIIRNHAETLITDNCIGRCNRMNGRIELRNIGREGDEIHIYAESAVEIEEPADGSSKLTKNHQKHDSITKQGMATLRKISSTNWVLSGDTFRSDRNNLTGNTINTDLGPEHIGRFNVYAPINDNNTNRVRLGFPADDTEAANMREGDEIEIYNSGSVVLEVLPTNVIQIWSVDSNTKVKPKGAAILKYMGKKSQKHTWALIGAIE